MSLSKCSVQEKNFVGDRIPRERLRRDLGAVPGEGKGMKKEKGKRKGEREKESKETLPYS